MKKILLASIIAFSTFLPNASNAQVVCGPGTPYFDARIVAKDTLAFEIQEALNKTLIDNDPDLVAVGACIDAQNIFNQAVALIDAASSGNLYTITKTAVVAIIEGVVNQAIREACSELRELIQENYGLIADTVISTFVTVTVGGESVPVIGVEF